jgi:hypothetical protein
MHWSQFYLLEEHSSELNFEVKVNVKVKDNFYRIIGRERPEGIIGIAPRFF